MTDRFPLFSPFPVPPDSPAYETSSLYCADAFRGKEASLLGRPWTAYCADSILGPMSRECCCSLALHGVLCCLLMAPSCAARGACGRSK